MNFFFWATPAQDSSFEMIFQLADSELQLPFQIQFARLNLSSF